MSVIVTSALLGEPRRKADGRAPRATVRVSSSRSASAFVTSDVAPDDEPAGIAIAEGLSKSSGSAVSRVAVSGIVTAELSVPLNVTVTVAFEPSRTEVGDTPRLANGLRGAGVASPIVTTTLDAAPATTPAGSVAGSFNVNSSSSRSESSTVASEPVAEVWPALTVMPPGGV